VTAHLSSGGERRWSKLLTTLLVCVGAVLLVPAAVSLSADTSQVSALDPGVASDGAQQPAITAGAVAEDPPDNDDDGDEDDVLGSVAVLPIDRARSAPASAEFVTTPECHFVRVLPSRSDSLRAPPQ
jgi:hypothetical protein